MPIRNSRASLVLGFAASHAGFGPNSGLSPEPDIWRQQHLATGLVRRWFDHGDLLSLPTEPIETFLPAAAAIDTIRAGASQHPPQAWASATVPTSIVDSTAWFQPPASSGQLPQVWRQPEFEQGAVQPAPPAQNFSQAISSWLFVGAPLQEDPRAQGMAPGRLPQDDQQRSSLQYIDPRLLGRNKNEDGYPGPDC